MCSQHGSLQEGRLEELLACLRMKLTKQTHPNETTCIALRKGKLNMTDDGARRAENNRRDNREICPGKSVCSLKAPHFVIMTLLFRRSVAANGIR